MNTEATIDKMCKTYEQFWRTHQEGDLRNRLKALPYHQATGLSPLNMLRSIAFDSGRRGLIDFARQKPEVQRGMLVDALERSPRTPERRVLEAIADTPRHLLVPEEKRPLAYWDGVVWVRGLNALTPPWLVCYAATSMQLQHSRSALVIGFGNGYASLVFSGVMTEASSVTAVELDSQLVVKGRKLVDSLGRRNISLEEGDGTSYYKGEDVFDAIWVTLGTRRVPDNWRRMLREGGRLGVFIPLTEQEVGLAPGVLPNWGSAVSYSDYMRTWWTNLKLVIYKKRNDDLVEIESMYGLFNPPIVSDSFGETVDCDWEAELAFIEREILLFLSQQANS